MSVFFICCTPSSSSWLRILALVDNVGDVIMDGKYKPFGNINMLENVRASG